MIVHNVSLCIANMIPYNEHNNNNKKNTDNNNNNLLMLFLEDDFVLDTMPNGHFFIISHCTFLSYILDTCTLWPTIYHTYIGYWHLYIVTHHILCITGCWPLYIMAYWTFYTLWDMALMYYDPLYLLCVIGGWHLHICLLVIYFN